MQIAVTGGTGFVGRDLVEVLLGRGDAVTIVTRDPGRVPAPCRGLVEARTWDGLDLSGHDAVVHLAGENLFASRWNDAQKERIRRSRVLGTTRLVEAIERAAPRPTVLVSASAVGYYGAHEEGGLDESAPAGTDFLARVCSEWEQCAVAARGHGCRVAVLRIGVVLDLGGGALQRMITPFRFFVGGPAGSGRQWMSWIHRRDVARLASFAIDKGLDGPVNATAPNPVRMSDFAKALGHALGRPSWLPAPGFALRLALGEVSEVILRGQKVLPRRALEEGFEFEYPVLPKALDEILTEEVIP